MKKSTAVFSLAAAAGLAALPATPALAVTPAYPNCDAAAAVGVYNIPAGAPGYGAHLDSDSDGIGCENGSVAYRPAPAAPVEAPQVGQVPVGGADTGITQDGRGDLGALALGGGLVLATAAGGTYLVRRRNAARA
ncbi:excalibur calcium-binding domain-containing protein [Arthrobacter mobilis]|uniref:excalibur calcium-binding domain-containing protein n=1 Tax=Arthrobacter mobilis TaxID=2724944 RepID=UPI001FEB2C3A|nr:excalibur calcium-binding domain-containing protein [Arthrobacter mobilis]